MDASAFRPLPFASLFAFAPPLLPSLAFTAFKSSADGMNLRLAASRPLLDNVVLRMPPMPYAGNIRRDRAMSAGGVDTLSAAILCAIVATGALTMFSARRCIGVHTTCMSGGERSCAAAPASCGAIPNRATMQSFAASGTTNAPPMVRQSRAANRT